ncbi:MarR family winged helix-turn-helix transcriptional regulator [Sphingomonas sp.]|uniref:MarR family winged helix-turn-helix transcriptional regulator n=1 Tax=Sphingomonas sp. TaxID=28214 RepID=UPI003D6C9003
MADLTERLVPIGLTVVEASLLWLVETRSGATQSDLGRTLGVQRANMVPLITKLAGRGLIQKTRVDGRSQGLSLTEAGRAQAKIVKTIIATHEAKFSTCLEGMDRAALFAMLQSVRSR